MARTTLRDILTDHDYATTALDRLGAVIDILEQTRCSYSVSSSMIRKAQKEQQRLLKIIDRTAAKLGAAYGS